MRIDEMALAELDEWCEAKVKEYGSDTPDGVAMEKCRLYLKLLATIFQNARITMEND